MTDIALMISALSAAVEAINKETAERGACLARHIRDAALFLMTQETGKEEEIGIIEEAEGEVARRDTITEELPHPAEV